MSTKAISIALIVIGICIMLVAFGMDTSVSTGSYRVQNIGLLSQQQNFLMFGGLLFLAGIILFAVARIKQTPEDDAKQKADVEATQKKIHDVAGRAASSVATEGSGMWKRITGHFSHPQDSRTGRTVTGLFVGICLAFPAAVLLSFGSVLVVFACLWFAFRPVPAVQAMRRLLAVNAIVFVIVGVATFGVLTGSPNDLDRPVFLVMNYSLFFVAFVSAISYWYVGRRKGPAEVTTE